MIDIDTFAIIGAKFCSKENLDDLPVQFVMNLFNYRVTVAEQIVKIHQSFELVYNSMISSNNAAINGGEYAQAIIDEFDQMIELMKSNRSIANDINFAILLAAQGTFLERFNEDKKTSIALVKIVENINSEIFGLDNIILLTVALWFSDYNNYQNLVYQKINDLKREAEGTLNKIYCVKCGNQIEQTDLFCFRCGQKQDSEKSDGPPSSKNSGNSPNSIINYDWKINLIRGFACDPSKTKDSNNYDQFLLRDFVTAYIEIAHCEPMSFEARGAFIRAILIKPEYAYLTTNLVAADFFIDEFDKFVTELADAKKYEFVQTMNYTCLNFELLEFSATDTGSYEGNWTRIHDHIEDVAKKMGWDGNYE